ncbi:MAG: anaerobic ribonucleoside-triphosphate reductase [Candidatus Hermodarchaeota archaeon]
MDLLPKVFRTEGKIAEFDPSKIFESILKETGMSEKDTKHITELVVRRIISSGIKFLSGPHIREIVCSILSEEHFENERKLYTRIGMPLMDYEEILEIGPRNKQENWINPEKIHHWAANQIAEEYAHLRILKNEESKAHLSGDIHINGLHYFVLRPCSQIWDPRLILRYGFPPIKELNRYFKYKPANSLKSAFFQLNKWLELVQSEFYGTQGLHFISNFLGPYLENLPEQEIIKEIQGFIYGNNILPLIIGRGLSPLSIQTSFCAFNELKDAPAIISGGKINKIYGNYHDQCTQFFKALLLSYKEIIQKYPFLSLPKLNILINENFINFIEDIFPNIWNENKLIDSIYFSNLLSNSHFFKKLEFSSKKKYLNYGILQNISLNLPRYAYISKDEDKFLELLRSKLNLCSNILLKKYGIIKKRINSKHLPFCGTIINGKSIFQFENQGLSISLIGLNEAIKYLTNYHLHENLEIVEFGKKILKDINQVCFALSESHNLHFILSENLSVRALKRFSLLDSKNFPKEVKMVTDNNYTNSVHFREDIDIDLLERVKVQEAFHEYIHEGAITYISLKELKNSEVTIKDFLTKISKDSLISNLKFILK